LIGPTSGPWPLMVTSPGEAACVCRSRACERRSKRPVPLQEAESGGAFGALAPNGQVITRGSLSTSAASSERLTSGPWPLMSDLQGRHAYQRCRECQVADLVVERTRAFE